MSRSDCSRVMICLADTAECVKADTIQFGCSISWLLVLNYSQLTSDAARKENGKAFFPRATVLQMWLRHRALHSDSIGVSGWSGFKVIDKGTLSSKCCSVLAPKPSRRLSVSYCSVLVFPHHHLCLWVVWIGGSET